MKAQFNYFFAAVLASVTFAGQAQEVTASLADDLKVSNVPTVKEEKAVMSFNKKVKLTNTENGKSVVVRISDRVKASDNNAMANVTKSAMDEIGAKSGKAKVKVQEIQGDDEVERFWATADASTANNVATPALKKTIKEREVEVETTKLEGFDINHVYDLNGKMQDLAGFGLQIAAFGQLKAAKEFATKLAKNGETEIEKIFIQVSKSADKPMVYRVVYGLFEDKTNAEDTQKKMEQLGYNSFVKGF